jgi:hypothetical protein
MPRVEIPLPPSFADDAEVPSPEDVSGNGSPGSTGTEGE